MVERGPGAVDVAQVADLGDPAVLGRVDVDEAAEDRGEGDVDPDRNGTELGLDPGGRGAHLVPVGHVCGYRQATPAPGLHVGQGTSEP